MGWTSHRVPKCALASVLNKVRLFSCLLHAFKKNWFNVKIDKWNFSYLATTHYFWHYTTINQSGINWTSNLFMWLIMTKKFGCICHIWGIFDTKQISSQFGLGFVKAIISFQIWPPLKNCAYQCLWKVWKLGVDIVIHLTISEMFSP